jgi:hypothetical protein
MEPNTMQRVVSEQFNYALIVIAYFRVFLMREATPDCSGTFTSPSASEVAKPVAGCHGISSGGGVRNDIIDDGKCNLVTLIFACGTSEQGNIGQIVGPPFVVALEREFGKGNVAVQGFNDYPAITEDYCTGDEML